MPASVHNDQVGSDLFGGVLREQTHIVQRQRR